MTKKQTCMENKTFGFWYGGFFDYGLEFKKIEEGIDTFVYCEGIQGEKKTFHKLKVKYTASGIPFIVWNNKRVRFDFVMRV